MRKELLGGRCFLQILVRKGKRVVKTRKMLKFAIN